jgi:hypothetical protein
MDNLKELYPLRGTTLLIVASDAGIAMAADDLQYSEKDGEAIPASIFNQKVFALEPNILIGVCGLGTHPKIKYEVKEWITEFIETQKSGPFNRPSDVVSALHIKMRDTFKVLEGMPEDRIWQTHKPGDRIVNFIVAGYADSFQRPYFFEIGTEVNRDGNGLIYIAPTSQNAKTLVHFGEDAFWLRATKGIEPESSARLSIHSNIESAVASQRTQPP